MGLVPCPWSSWDVPLYISPFLSPPSSCLHFPFFPSPPRLPRVCPQNPGWWVDLLKVPLWVGHFPLALCGPPSIRLVLNSTLHSGTGWEPPSCSSGCLGESQAPAFLPEGPGAIESRYSLASGGRAEAGDPSWSPHTSLAHIRGRWVWSCTGGPPGITSGLFAAFGSSPPGEVGHET